MILKRHRAAQHTTNTQTSRHNVEQFSTSITPIIVTPRSQIHTSQPFYFTYSYIKIYDKLTHQSSIHTLKYFLFFFLMIRPPPKSPLFPYPTLSRSAAPAGPATPPAPPRSPGPGPARRDPHPTRGPREPVTKP